MSISKDDEIGVNSRIVKKGILWQQNGSRKGFKNIFKHKWKQRYFILTNSYIACFKKKKSKICEMGLFLFKLSLTEIKSVTMINDTLNINADSIILWDGDNSLIIDWFNCINDAKNSCLKRTSSNSSLINSKSTPVLDTKRLNRISVLSAYERRLSSISSSSSSSHLLPDPPTFPRLAPQCKGVINSSSSHFNTTGPPAYHLKPCPFTLSISPSLTQRSLYAQKILSSTSSPNPTPTHSKFFRPFKSSLTSTTSSSFLHYATQPRLQSSSNLKSAASEFSFISLSSTGASQASAQAKAQQQQQQQQQQQTQVLQSTPQRHLINSHSTLHQTLLHQTLSRHTPSLPSSSGGPPSSCPSDSPRFLSSSQSPSHHGSFDSDSPPPPPVPPPRIGTTDRRIRPCSYYIEAANTSSSYSSSSSTSAGTTTSMTLPSHNRKTSPLVDNLKTSNNNTLNNHNHHHHHLNNIINNENNNNNNNMNTLKSGTTKKKSRMVRIIENSSRPFR
ncbi:ras guanine nucleotide exchange factor P-like [Panonychus citri]|uniref:ras guanine nucleotide exchange factor P-like n=1 Tax=Panonychus citri TaxID=50023 RepID=UPI002307D59D|nr:ras guanine nucleotide exchange factor P-like [Panonychus citri]